MENALESLTITELETGGSCENSVLRKLQEKYTVLKSSNTDSEPEDDNDVDDTLKLSKRQLYSIDAVQLGWNNYDWLVGAGMYNLGNSCYLNSTLQALFHVPSFVNWLMSDRKHIAHCQDSGGQCIISAMRKTLQDFQHHAGNNIRPDLIYNKLRLVCRNLTPGRQEDAHEFLRYLVEGMEKAYLSRFRDSADFDFKIKETTPLNQILGGYLRSSVRCMECGHVSTTFQHFQDLLLDIRKAQSLDEALELYFSREDLDDETYKCELCQKQVQATKQFSLERAPMVLCIQLKRFSITNDKITKHLSFRQRLEITKNSRQQPNVPLSYRLVSIVSHVGSTMGCGHYIALAQAPSGKFYQIDDSLVRPISHQVVFNTKAYIMFYELESSPYTQKAPPKVKVSAPPAETVRLASTSNSSASKTLSNGIGCTSEQVYGPQPSQRLQITFNGSGTSIITSPLLAGTENALESLPAGSTKKALPANIELETGESYENTVLKKLQERCTFSESSDTASKPEKENDADDTLKLSKRQLYPIDAVQLGWNNTEWLVGAGMANLGNTCYVNSTLQALFHVPAFGNWLMSDSKHNAHCQDSGGQCIICAMRKTLQDAQHHAAKTIRPYLICNKLRQVCRNLTPGRQEDAHEFLRCLVEGMEKAYLRRFRDRADFDYKIKETTPLNQILGGYLMSSVKCLECGHVSTTFQHFQDLLLDIRKAQSLDEALELYFSREDLDDMTYKCEFCQKKVQATKQFSLERAPMVLCIQLKRFSITNEKITKHISFRQRLEITKYSRQQPKVPLIYRLVSIVTHVGPTVGRGHYTAVAQAPSGKFYRFDDNVVRPISHQVVFNTKAYIMFYELESSPYTQKAPPEVRIFAPPEETVRLVSTSNEELLS